MQDHPTPEEIEETEAALRASLERAHELVCEAREVIRSAEENQVQVPGSAS